MVDDSPETERDKGVTAIYVTRPEPKASESAAFFRRAGREAHAAPLTRLAPTAPSEHPTLPAEINLETDRYRAAIFTSANAAKFLAWRAGQSVDWSDAPFPDDRAKFQEEDAKSVCRAILDGSIALIVLGDKTAEACREIFQTDPEYIARVPNQVGLADELNNSELIHSGDRLLMPCAAGASTHLKEKLRRRNIRVDISPIYESKTIERAEFQKAYRSILEDAQAAHKLPWIAFYAPSQAKALQDFRDAADAPADFIERARLVAIGPTTATAVEKAFARSPDAVAETPSDEGILAAIQAAERNR